MRRVQRRLEGMAPDQTGASTDVRTVWFNAWAAPEAQALEGLIRSVLDQLDTNVLRRIARKRKLVSGLRWPCRSSPVLSRRQRGRPHLGAGVDRSEAAQRAQRLRPGGDGRHGSPSRHSEGRLIVVFVDDLDRCSSSTVLQVFEAMKLYLDAPGFVFVLGWDTEQVLRAVAAEKGTEDRLRSATSRRSCSSDFASHARPMTSWPSSPTASAEAAGVTDYVLAREHRQLLMNTTGGNPRQLKRLSTGSSCSTSWWAKRQTTPP